MTPLNIAFWGNLNPATAPLLKTIQISPFEVFKTVSVILILPLVFGMMFAHLFPDWSKKLEAGLKYLSVLFLIVFIGLALVKNFEHFIQFVGSAVIIVALTNGLGLLLGYHVSLWAGLSVTDARAVSFETGIQNAGFGLILIFNFFDGLGGMAVIAAWWGIWHIFSGLSLAMFWSRKPPLSDEMIPAI